GGFIDRLQGSGPPDHGQVEDFLVFHGGLRQLSPPLGGDVGSVVWTRPALLTLRGSLSNTRPGAPAFLAESPHSARVSAASYPRRASCVGRVGRPARTSKSSACTS